MKGKILNYLLLITFVCTIMVPLTGIKIHKLSSALFLILCVVHTIIHRKNMDKKRFALIGMVVVSFISGILGMIFEEIAVIMILHRVISICIVFFMAIHIFIYRRKYMQKSVKC